MSSKLELQAQQIDLAVHLESQSTVAQLQDRTLEGLRDDVTREGVDVRNALDNEARKARGRVDLPEAENALRRLLPRAQARDLDIRVLLKRYYVANSFDYRKLADDLAPGGHGYGRQAERGPDHRPSESSKVNEEQLQSIKRRIVEALNKDNYNSRAPGIAGLHQALARADAGGSSGGIPSGAFFAELEQFAVSLNNRADLDLDLRALPFQLRNVFMQLRQAIVGIV